MQKIIINDCWGNSSPSEFTRQKYMELTGKELQDIGQCRTDPILIDIIERYGEQNHSSMSKPVVIEIPDDIEWEIYDYDGVESVHEKHRYFEPASREHSMRWAHTCMGA